MMKPSRLILLLILTLIIPLISLSQDFIHKIDGTKFEAKVVEVREYQIRYKKYSKPDGPVYLIDISDVLAIEYENGISEVFNSTATLDEKKPNVGHRNNVISFHLLDLVFCDLALSYSRILSEGQIALTIPVGLGFGIENFHAREQKYNSYYSGVGISFYPYGQKRFNYFFGASVRAGMAKYMEETFVQVPTSHWEYNKNEFLYGKLLFSNGIDIIAAENLSFTFVLDIGLKYLEKEIVDYYEQGVSQAGWFSIKMGWRF